MGVLAAEQLLQLGAVDRALLHAEQVMREQNDACL
jgi:hypothetical protein